MKPLLLVINILVLLIYTSVYGQDSIESINVNNSEEVQFKRLHNVQQKYLNWIDRSGKEFPFAVPALAYNQHDGLQIGAAMINLKQPVKNVDFSGSLFYGIESRKVNGTAAVDYYLRRKNGILTEFKPGVKFQSFTYKNISKPLKYYAIHPEAVFTLHHRTEKLEKLEHKITVRNHTILRKEITFDYANSTFTKDTLTRFYANVLNYTFKRNDKNFPLSASLNMEQSGAFLKASFEANSFIRYQLKNYNTGVHLRFFMGGFLWRSNTYKFRLNPDVGFNLNGKRGSQDYLFEDFYFGRSSQEGFTSGQVSASDGFFKVSTPLNAIETGQTVDWLMAFNLVVDFPIKFVPLKLFLDMGYSFDNHLNPNNLLPVKGFQYDAGFMFSFFDRGFEIYFPLLMSKEFKNYYKSNAPKFGQRISFLIDLHKLELHKKIRDLKF
jgi:hypothetical protein